MGGYYAIDRTHLTTSPCFLFQRKKSFLISKEIFSGSPDQSFPSVRSVRWIHILISETESSRSNFQISFWASIEKNTFPMFPFFKPENGRESCARQSIGLWVISTPIQSILRKTSLYLWKRIYIWLEIFALSSYTELVKIIMLTSLLFPLTSFQIFSSNRFCTQSCFYLSTIKIILMKN